jgi:hypothetical protein
METIKTPRSFNRRATAIAAFAILAGQSVGAASAATDGFSIFARPIADTKDQTPRDVPRRAAEALVLAKKWQSDAILIEVRTREDFDYALDFSFRSPSTKSRFHATYAKGRMNSQVFPPVSNSSDDDPIPLTFIDLPAALAQAQKQGMNTPIKEAWLDVSRSGQGLVVTWQIQADTDHYPYLFKVSAMQSGVQANNGGSAFGVPPGSAAIVPDSLYNAVLNARLTNLPIGVSGARTTAVDLADDDRRAGITGILQVTFTSSDPTAKVNYVFTADAAQAKSVADRTNAMIRGSGASPVFLPFAPNTDCAGDARTGHMTCTAAVDRVVVISFATQMEGRNNNARGPVSLAGPVIKSALDHLANVKKASGKN